MKRKAKISHKQKRGISRRDFMKGAVGAAASLTVLSQPRARAAGEKIIIGVMGLGGRGTYLAEKFPRRPDVEIAYLSDPNTRRFARAREAVDEAQGKKPKMVQDFRKIPEDRNVDALINATPDHWHGLGTIMACQAGGVNALTDGRQTPDTQLATFEYGSLTLLMESALWTPYIKKIPSNIRDSDRFPDWPFCSTRIEILGTEGFMYYGRHGGGWQAYDAKGELVRSEYGRQADKEHQDNFIDCIRTRKRPNADVEIGHQTVLLCHMANISYRVGNLKLEFDPQTETFTNCDKANQYIKREYREPWVVPDNV